MLRKCGRSAAAFLSGNRLAGFYVVLWELYYGKVIPYETQSEHFQNSKRNSQIQQKQNESEKLLRNFAFLDLNDLYDHFSVSGSGLTAKQAEQLQEEYGKNIITTGQSNTTLHRLVNAVVNPFNIVLLIIAVITLFTDVIYSQHRITLPYASSCFW